MTYAEAMDLYRKQHPGADLSAPAVQDAFNQWSASLGPGGFEHYVLPGQAAPFANYPEIEKAYRDAQALDNTLDPADFAVTWANNNPTDPRLNDPNFLKGIGIEPAAGTSAPAEQVLGNYALDQARLQIDGDAKRRDDAAALLAQYQPSLNSSRQLIADLGTTIDAQKYFETNPDVAAAFVDAQAQNPLLTAEQFAQGHYDRFGRNEGRAFPAKQSKALTDELAASAGAAAAQTAALNTQIAALTQNLSGELAAKAGNLQTAIAALTSNQNNFTAAERASLASQVNSQFQALETEVATKRQSISAQIASMQGAIGEHDASLRAALQTELNQLNAAQAPLNAARISAAETVAASVNLGAQAQQDHVRADAASAGFIGSSTGTDMAIARAAIGGRQSAAEAMGGARVANAADTAGIARYGANTGFGIAANTAGAQRDTKIFGAGENRSLTDYGATGRRAISDFGSAGTREIDKGANTAALNIGNFGATEGRTLNDSGATAGRAINDLAANDARNIADSAAARGLSFFSNDLQRRIAGLSLPSAAINTELGIRTALDNYGNSGFTRAMTDLNFFRTNGGNAPSANPFTNNTAVDNGLGNLGAGLVSLAGGIAKGNNYWTKPSTTTPPPSGNNWTIGSGDGGL